MTTTTPLIQRIKTFVRRNVAPFLVLYPDSDYPTVYWTWRYMTYAYESGQSCLAPCFDPICPQYEQDSEWPYDPLTMWGDCRHKRRLLGPCLGDARPIVKTYPARLYGKLSDPGPFYAPGGKGYAAWVSGSRS